MAGGTTKSSTKTPESEKDVDAAARAAPEREGSQSPERPLVTSQGVQASPRNLTALQRLVGNAAVSAMVQRQDPPGGGGGGAPPEVHAGSNGPGGGSGPAPIQGGGGGPAPEGGGGGGGGPAPVEGGGGGPAPVGGGGGGEAPIGEGEGPAPSPVELRRAAQEQVAGLPEAPEEELDNAQQAAVAGRAEGRDMEEFHLDQRPHLAALIQQDAAHEDGAAPPGRMARFLGWAGSGLSTAGDLLVRGVKSIGQGIWAGLSFLGRGLKAIGSGIASGAKSAYGAISGALSRDKDLDQTTKGESHSTTRRRTKVARAGTTVSSRGASATGLASHLPNIAAGTASVMTKVAGAVGIFFSAIQGALDLRALISSGRQVKHFRQMAEDARQAGHSPDVIEAVQYAMEQKYSKAVKRAIALTGGVLSIVAGAGLLAITLASNPVGWFILAAIAGVGAVLGLGAAVYKFYRWAKKKSAGDLGAKREKMAGRIVELLKVGSESEKETARQVIVELHLEPDTIATQPNVIAIDMVKEKLKSA